MAGVDVQEREGQPGLPAAVELERLLREVEDDARILAAGKEQRRPLERGRGLAQDEDRLFLERVELGGVELGLEQAVERRRRVHAGAPIALAGGGDVQAAFLDALLPPPATGAEVFADGDRARARRAADAREEAVVERVVRDVVHVEVVPDVGPAPVGERAELAAAGVVGRLELDLGALARLLAAQARDPRRAAGEHAAERLDLAHRAARLPQLDALPHRVLAVAADEGDHRLVHRAIALDANVVALADVVDQQQRLAVQHAGVERGDGDRQAILARSGR